MISNQRKCLAPDRGNVTDPNGIPDCQRFGHQPPLHRMENGMDADDALNLLRGPQISLPSSIRPTNTILYFSPSIGCKCNSNGWKFVRRGKRSMHPKKKWREGKIVTDCWILSDRCNRSFQQSIYIRCMKRKNFRTFRQEGINSNATIWCSRSSNKFHT